jgi:hypothetical protein
MAVQFRVQAIVHYCTCTKLQKEVRSLQPERMKNSLVCLARRKLLIEPTFDMC